MLTFDESPLFDSMVKIKVMSTVKEKRKRKKGRKKSERFRIA